MTEKHSVTCTNCGGDVVVKTQAARVANCPYCQTTLVVNQQAVKALGKMALLAETASCLAVGWRAECLGREIQVLGRIQYRYGAGLWDEWWVQFSDDGSDAWISQDEDQYMLERRLEKLKAPDFDSITAGDRYHAADHKLWVEEKGEATMVGMQGELPLDAAPDVTMRYVSLTDNRIKLTIEYFPDGSYLAFQGKYLQRKDLRALDSGSEAVDDSLYQPPIRKGPAATPPVIRSGKQQGKDAGDSDRDGDRDVVASREGIEPQSIDCPSCGGTVTIRDSKGTAMLVCQFCNAALDVSVPGPAKLLYESEQRKLPFPIAIGSVAKLKGVQWTVLGRVRYQEDDPSGVWTWDELQLHNPQRGYIFLALEDGHWMLFEPLEHRIQYDPRYSHKGSKFTFHGQTFKVFERSRALITYVEGELSWVARTGDKLSYMDAIRPPQMISAEWTRDELEWTIGRYLPRAEVAAAFNTDANKLPRPVGVAPAQPFKRTAGQVIRAWSGLAVSLTLLLIGLATFAFGRGEEILNTGHISSDQYLTDRGYISKPFHIPEGRHICRLIAEGHGLNNAWVGLSVALLDEQQDVVFDADSVVESYHGVQGGESWSEGSTSDAKLFRLSGPVDYRLNIFGEAGRWSQLGGDQKTQRGASVTVRIRRDVTPARYFFAAGIFVLFYPLWEFGRGVLFESSRWPSDDDD